MILFRSRHSAVRSKTIKERGKMILKTLSVGLLLLLIACFTDPPIQAQEGAKLYTSKFCITCHGRRGVSVAPNYPDLAGQNKRYIVN